MMQPNDYDDLDNDHSDYDVSADAAESAKTGVPFRDHPVGAIRSALDEQLHSDPENAAKAIQKEYGPKVSAKTKGKHARALSLEHPEDRAPRVGSTGLTMVQAGFIMAFRICPSGPYAAKAAGISISTVERWRSGNPVFAKAYAEAYEAARSALFTSMWISAVEGDVEPVYQGGIRVGYRRKFSDRMRELLAKATMPEMFDRKALAAAGPVVNIKATPAEIAEVVRRLSPTRRSETIEVPMAVERQRPANGTTSTA